MAAIEPLSSYINEINEKEKKNKFFTKNFMCLFITIDTQYLMQMLGTKTFNISLLMKINVLCDKGNVIYHLFIAYYETVEMESFSLNEMIFSILSEKMLFS